jgi:hypothetical protein
MAVVNGELPDVAADLSPPVCGPGRIVGSGPSTRTRSRPPRCCCPAGRCRTGCFDAKIVDDYNDPGRTMAVLRVLPLNISCA